MNKKYFLVFAVAAWIFLAPHLSHAAAAQELFSTSLYSDPSLISYYRFEGNANDSKGNNNGAGSGVSYSTDFGKFGQGAGFDGHDSVVFLPQISIAGNPITLSAWVYPTSIFPGGRQISLWSQAGIFMGTASTDGVNISAYTVLSTTNNNLCQTGLVGSVTPNAWNLIVVTYDNMNANVYVNGALAGSVTCGGTLTQASFGDRIGIAENMDPNQAFGGYLDDAAIFARALKASEIAALYGGALSSQKEPVVIVPGIFGSELKNGQWRLQSVFKPYDALKATLVANGYVQDQTLFDFPYDWEKVGIPAIARQLKDRIQAIKSICGCSKVNVVAHSMGGLVARQYVESNLYQTDIDQMVFLGTPQLGSTDSYLAWEGGESKNVDPTAVYMERYFFQKAVEAGATSSLAFFQQDIFNYMHSASSPVFAFQELLPTYNYLRDTSNGTMRAYPTNYPKNDFLENLNSASSLAALQQSGVRITNIYSDDQSDTTNVIDVKEDNSLSPLWNDGAPQSFESVVGDGTVIKNSALAINGVNSFQVGGSHFDLPTTADGKIVQILTGITNPVIAPPPSVFRKFLSVIPLSPVDILVTAPDGSKIGKDFSTGQEINQIDGAYYSGFDTPNESVVIPNPEDGQYIVATQGTGSGAYHVLMSYGYDGPSSATSSDVMFAGNTQPGLIENLNMTINASTPATNTIIPQDIVPPVISYSAINPGYLLNATSTKFFFSAIDAGVGLFSVTSTLDGAPFLSGATINFDKPGDHVIAISAVDFVGNIANATITYNVAYRFGGFLPPLTLKTDRADTYELGKTIPIKFRLTDANGRNLSSAKAKLTVTNIKTGAIGINQAIIVAVAFGNNGKGDDKDDSDDRDGNSGHDSGFPNIQYLYNLQTKSLSFGTWRVTVTLDDGNSYSSQISLKKD